MKILMVILLASCGSSSVVATKPTVVRDTIVKHDTVRITDTLYFDRVAWYIDQWRDTLVLDCDGNLTAFNPDNHDTIIPPKFIPHE